MGGGRGWRSIVAVYEVDFERIHVPDIRMS
jgi:hypothetical protein